MFCSKFGSGDPGAGPSEERAEGGRGVFNGKMDSDLDLPLGGVWPAGPPLLKPPCSGHRNQTAGLLKSSSLPR
jgi:hypothetical protein